LLLWLLLGHQSRRNLWLHIRFHFWRWQLLLLLLFLGFVFEWLWFGVFNKTDSMLHVLKFQEIREITNAMLIQMVRITRNCANTRGLRYVTLSIIILDYLAESLLQIDECSRWSVENRTLCVTQLALIIRLHIRFVVLVVFRIV